MTAVNSMLIAQLVNLVVQMIVTTHRERYPIGANVNLLEQNVIVGYRKRIKGRLGRCDVPAMRVQMAGRLDIA